MQLLGNKPSLSCLQIEEVFNCTFSDLSVVLRGGGEEPNYFPAASQTEKSQIIYRLDYPASALHEVAHWCIAGAQRRLLEDFGYWYAPDGRNQEEQSIFYQVEVKPQALEWIFADVSGIDFEYSADNLSGDLGSGWDTFRENVQAQKQRYLGQGLPKRASRFVHALCEYRSHICSRLS